MKNMSPPNEKETFYRKKTSSAQSIWLFLPFFFFWWEVCVLGRMEHIEILLFGISNKIIHHTSPTCHQEGILLDLWPQTGANGKQYFSDTALQMYE